jgi:glycosyltransferase involved in cell wall biosynthesis
MKQTGHQSTVLNIDTRAPVSDAYIKISGAADLLKELLRHVCNDWTLHVHTNGHNPKSWLIALVCGVAAQLGPGATLTLHSGVAPEYLRGGPEWRRTIARMACVLYERIVCVNHEIAAALMSLGVPARQLEITPAYLPVKPAEVSIPENIQSWMRQHLPVLSTTMFFRPEYGFELLVRAVSMLRRRHPGVGCLVMGSGENRDQAEAFVAQQGLRNTIFLAGDLEHELCLKLMSRCSVFVRPTFRDGDSISVREAMSVGVPVVASMVGTRPEGTLLFDAGDLDGLITQIENALRREIS